MKTSIIIFFFLALGKISYGQLKQSIDYQYYRDDKSYYAFELFKDIKNLEDNQLMINFTSNTNFSKIDKISIISGALEFKLKFKDRADVVHSDNPEQKFYPISISKKDLMDKKIPCEAIIIFKMDNGTQFSLPFYACSIKDFIAKN